VGQTEQSLRQRHSDSSPAVLNTFTFGSVTINLGTPPCAPRVLKSMGLMEAAATLISTSPGRLWCTPHVLWCKVAEHSKHTRAS
jgi:hypothetical protein